MNETRAINRLDDEIEHRLFKLIRTHLRLALEHGQASTNQERREAIRIEIEALRIERDKLIEKDSC